MAWRYEREMNMGSVTDSSVSRNMRFLNTSRVCTASRFSALTSLKVLNMSEMSTSSCSAALSSCVPSSLSAALDLSKSCLRDSKSANVA